MNTGEASDVVAKRQRWQFVLARRGGQDLADRIGKTKRDRNAVAVNADVVVELGSGQHVGHDLLDVGFSPADLDRERIPPIASSHQYRMGCVQGRDR